ncbi:MAG: hypothetical protein MH132_06085 [Hydrotalea sp.]|nr:hypothetical protein [Hydrotalea sp.]
MGNKLNVRELVMLSPIEIQEKLPKWEQQWAMKQKDHPNAKVINPKLKQLKSNLKKIMMLPNQTFFQQFDCAVLFNEIMALEKLNNFNNDLEKLLTPASDKIKLFKKYAKTYDDVTYWKELAEAYILQNYNKIAYSTYYKLFSVKRNHREELMSKEEREVLSSLPEVITIYRAGSTEEEETLKYGISWTLNKAIANKFAKVKSLRDKVPMKIFELKIAKSEVIAYFKSRNEEEIIYIHKSKKK